MEYKDISYIGSKGSYRFSSSFDKVDMLEDSAASYKSKNSVSSNLGYDGISSYRSPSLNVPVLGRSY